jgi:hypothetical protein
MGTTSLTDTGITFPDSTTQTTAAAGSGGGTMTGALKIDVDNVPAGALRIEANQTHPDYDYHFAQEIYSTLSGGYPYNTTGDREQGGLYLDINSTQTGGNTSHEHRAYGIYCDLDSTGSSDWVYGGYFSAVATPASGTASEVVGVYGYAEDNGGTGAVSNVYGVKGLAYSDNSTSDTNYLVGGYFVGYASHDSGYITEARGVHAQIEVNGTQDILGTSMVYEAQYDNDTNVSQTHTSYLYYGNYDGTMPTTAYGVYINDDVPNVFLGSIQAGVASTPSDTSTAAYGFYGDTNTGMYSPAEHSLGLMVNGSRKVHVTTQSIRFHNVTSGVEVDGTLEATEFHGDGSNLTNLPAGGYNMQVFTSSGTYTKTSGVKDIKVTVIGGGGGGGGTRNSNTYTGGGGGGGTAIEFFDASSVSSSVTITVGSGGSGGGYSSGYHNGVTGGSSSFGSYCSATGGQYGSSSYFDGDGGTATGGTVNISGQSGVRAGGEWYPASKGGDSHYASGGAGGRSNGNYFIAEAGTGFGAGGAGIVAGDKSFGTGGAGIAGAVIVEEFF